MHFGRKLGLLIRKLEVLWRGIVPFENPGRTCAVMCMDKRIHGWWFRGCYRVLNAGPRVEDSLRSILLFVDLHPCTPDNPIFILWLSHDGVCACSKHETRSSDSHEVERHTALMREQAVQLLRTHPRLAEPIRNGSIRFRSGEIKLGSISIEWAAV